MNFIDVFSNYNNTFYELSIKVFRKTEQIYKTEKINKSIDVKSNVP